MYYDIYYVLFVLPAVIFALVASASVKMTFKKYSKAFLRSGMTGAEAARMVLDANGLNNVGVERIAGKLTDHYDPRRRIIRLSTDVYDASTPAAVGVAAHEAGHAIQHASGYAPLKIRNAIVPATNIGSKLSIPLIIIGLILTYYSESYILVAYAGVVCFSLCVIFQLITLPTEFNASRRAVSALSDCGRLDENEIYAAKKVLTAAAMTYVAALAVAIMQLLRLLLIVNRSRK